LEADTAIIKYARNIFNAVSAGFISKKDLLSPEAAAKIRVRLGTKFYAEKVEKDLALLNFAYNAIYLITVGSGRYEQSSIDKHNKDFYAQYQQVFGVFAGKPVKRTKDGVAVPAASSEFSDMREVFDYLFMK